MLISSSSTLQPTMTKHVLIASGVTVVGVLAYFALAGFPAAMDLPFTAREAGFDDVPTTTPLTLGVGGWYTAEELRTYTRPEGPLRVGLQVGHWRNDEVPEELSALTQNGDGATWGQLTERELMEQIAARIMPKLEAAGVVVDLLPATVPPKYEADAFVSLHADGNSNTRARGFKIAGPRRDFSGRSDELVLALREAYGAATGLPEDDLITRRMTAYYAFNWPRFLHAVHPYTPAAIVETGFLTNATDRAFLVGEQERIAEGVAAGVLAFLATDRTPTPPLQELAAPVLPLTGELACAPVRADRRGTTTPPCVPAVAGTNGAYYLVSSTEPVATSTLPFKATVSGVYRSLFSYENYFWFPYEVRGVIDGAGLQLVE